MQSSDLGKVQLSGQTLLVLSLPRHDGKYTSTPWQISVELAKNNTVIFVDHPYTIMDAVTNFKDKAIRKRLKAYLGKNTIVKDGVEVILSPFVLPVNFLPKGKLYNVLSALNHRIVAARINRYLKKKNIDSLLYVNSFNFYFSQLYQYIKPGVNINIYHCIDPMVKAFTLKHGPYLQQQAAEAADAIISTAPSLQQNFTDKGFTKSYLVPNAANFQLFSQATHAIAIHPSLKNLEGKVLGYLGNIERRTDFKLLQKIIDLLPGWTLAMVGPVERHYVPDEFFTHTSVLFTGPIAHHDAPAVVKRFDITMIPFQCDEVSRGIYPLKLYEYLAAGKPVVSTNFNPEVLSSIGDVVQVAHSPEEFAEHVLLAYATDSPSKKEERIRVASQNTWEERVKLFGKIIAQELSNKQLKASVASS